VNPSNLRLPVAVALGIALQACDGHNGERPLDVEALRREVAQATDTLAREAVEQRDGAREAIEKKLADLDRRITKARQTAARAQHVKRDAERQLAELEREGRRLRRRVDEVRRAGTRAWAGIETSVDRALEELESAWGASEDGAPAR
jgi:chromosome segregation ATPase